MTTCSSSMARTIARDGALYLYGNNAPPLSLEAHENLRVRRLVRERQDDADREADPAVRPARTESLACQARAPHLRRGSAGEGLLSPPARRLHRGAGELVAALGAGARAARRAGAGICRADRAALALRPGAGRRLQARAASEAGGLPRGYWRGAAASRGPGHRRA